MAPLKRPTTTLPYLDNMKSFLLIFLLGVFSFASAEAADKPNYSDKPANPAMARIEDDPKLPRVLLIGDSISIGYTLPVRSLLAGRANVHRIPANGGPTTNGLAHVEEWLGTNRWHVIHFNWGLHDLKILSDGRHMVPIDQYEKNLEELVRRLQKTGAKLIWASTTPVPEGKLGPLRKPGDEIAYNVAAMRVMEKNGVSLNDLYAFALPQLAKIQSPANVHFTSDGSAVLAEPVAKAISTALAPLGRTSSTSS